MSNISRFPPSAKTVHVEAEIPASQLTEFSEAVVALVAGERPRMDTLDRDLAAITRQAMTALKTIETAINDHPTSGQARRMVRFLAGVYNGADYPFDLTDLRALDTELANACLDYLNYDRIAKAEVHTHLPGGGAQMQRWIAAGGITPPVRLREDTQARLVALAERSSDDSARYLQRALEDFLAPREATKFGGLQTQRANSGESEMIHHIRRLSDPVVASLCGAEDGPWKSTAFHFSRDLSPDCHDAMLERRALMEE